MRTFEYRVQDEHVNQPYHTIPSKALIEGLTATTTAHGIPHFHNARGKAKRIFWCLMSIAAVAGLIMHLTYIGELFAQYNVAVKIDILQMYSMNFPAVTFCNMNPVKSSALESNPQVQNMLDGSATNQNRKRRKKRYAAYECKTSAMGQDYSGTVSVTVSGRTCQRWDATSPHYPNSKARNSTNFPEATLAEASNYCRNPDKESQGPWCYTTDPSKRWEFCDLTYCNYFSTTCTPDMINDKTGLCYGIVNPTGNKDYTGNRDDCAAGQGTLAIITDMDKVNFLKSRPQIFTGLGASIDTYYFFMKKMSGLKIEKPQEVYFLTKFLNYATGHQTADDCLVARISDHKWENVPCSSTTVGLCEKIVQCPYPVFDNGDGTTSCFVFLEKHQDMSWAKGERMCRQLNIAQDHYMAEIKSDAEWNHVITSGAFDDVTVDNYWINGKIDGSTWEWQRTGDPMSFFKWNASAGIGSCVRASISNDHLWTQHGCTSSTDQGLALCEIINLPYVPPAVETTEGQTTLTDQTTEAQTTEEQNATLETTTVEGAVSDIITTVEEATTITATPAGNVITTDPMRGNPTTDINNDTTVNPQYDITTGQDANMDRNASAYNNETIGTTPKHNNTTFEPNKSDNSTTNETTEQNVGDHTTALPNKVGNTTILPILPTQTVPLLDKQMTTAGPTLPESFNSTSFGPTAENTTSVVPTTEYYNTTVRPTREKSTTFGPTTENVTTVVPTAEYYSTTVRPTTENDTPIWPNTTVDPKFVNTTYYNSTLISGNTTLDSNTTVDTAGEYNTTMEPNNSQLSTGHPKGLSDNLALGKPAYQMSIYNPYVAGKAVDGDRCDTDPVSMSHTKKELHPWWYVDLQASYTIFTVNITNRKAAAYSDRMKEVYVLVTEIDPATAAPNINNHPLCAYNKGPLDPGGPTPFHCSPGGITGRYVIVQLDADVQLHMCEVEVFGSSQTTGWPHETGQTTIELTTSATEPTTSAIELTTSTTKQTTEPTTTTQKPSTIPPTLSFDELIATPASLPGSAFPERKVTKESFQKEEKLSETLATLDQETKTQLGYQPFEFIVDCQYEGVECNPLIDFQHFYNPFHGNCYTFNAGWNTTDDMLLSHRTGRRYGLQVTMNIGVDDYLDTVGGSAGARIVVHPRGIMPHPEEQGIMAKPGELTSVGVIKNIIHREPFPYGNCSIKYNDKTKDVYAEHFPVNYTRMGCFKTCYQRNVIEQCGCFDANVLSEGAAFGYKTVPVCQISDIKQDDCKYNVTKQYIQGQLGCSSECPNVCNDEYYEPLSSTSTWPSSKHLNKVVENLGPKITRLIEKNDPSVFRENLVRVEVFYEEFNYKRLQEYPAYKPESFLSDMGGILGLWLGFSVLTIFEFFEFGVDGIIYFFVWLKIGRKKTPVQQVSEATTSSTVDTTQNQPKSSDNKHIENTPVIAPPPNKHYMLRRKPRSRISSPHYVDDHSPPPPYSSRQNSFKGSLSSLPMTSISQPVTPKEKKAFELPNVEDSEEPESLNLTMV